MDKIGYQEEEIPDEGEEAHHQDENDHQNEPTESRARLSNIHEPEDIEVEIEMEPMIHLAQLSVLE